MISSRNIKKVFFHVDKTYILISVIILILNISINFFTNIIIFSEAITSFLSQIIINFIAMSYAYLIMYAIGQTVMSVPYLTSLNCPRKYLGKTLIISGLKRNIIITFIFLILKLFIINQFMADSSTLFFIRVFLSSNLIDTFSITGIYFLIGYFIFNYFAYLCLTGLTVGWQYVLSSILVLLGTCFLLFKQITLLFVFGLGFNIFIIILIILNIILNIVNYKYIKTFEYKY